MISNAEEARILAESGLLSGIPDHQLRQLAFASERFTFTDGAVIVQQGEYPDKAFVVLSGEAGVFLKRDGAETQIMRLGTGELLGATALISGGDYRATARALGEVEVLRIPRDAFLALLESDKAAMAGVLEYLAKQQATAKTALGITFD
ncbi:MAG: cyclic nucleotide-binding domain-containing protein [Pseudomonadota bacterium]